MCFCGLKRDPGDHQRKARIRRRRSLDRRLGDGDQDFGAAPDERANLFRSARGVGLGIGDLDGDCVTGPAPTLGKFIAHAVDDRLDFRVIGDGCHRDERHLFFRWAVLCVNSAVARQHGDECDREYRRLERSISGHGASVATSAGRVNHGRPPFNERVQMAACHRPGTPQ